MKVLIVGEFSAFAKHLKNGFKELGHSVTIVQSGDGFKKISCDDDDIKYTFRSLNLFGRKIPFSHRLFYFFENNKISSRIKQLNDGVFDIIVVVNYLFLSRNKIRDIGVSLKYLQQQKAKGAKIIMSCCGGDPATRSYLPKMYKQMGIMLRKKDYKDSRFDKLINLSNVIIPISIDYFNAITKYCSSNNKINISNVIPLPITIDKEIQIIEPFHRKIVVFHGIIRPKEKGTFYFQEAMDRLERDFPNRVICISKGGMPYDEYVKLFNEVDILCDQVYGHGMGVNAAIGLMNGKVVLGGNSIESEKNMGIYNCPIINVEPDANQIYEILRDLILSPEKIVEIKMRSRNYAIKYLDSKIIAQRYIATMTCDK